MPFPKSNLNLTVLNESKKRFVSLTFNFKETDASLGELFYSGGMAMGLVRNFPLLGKWYITDFSAGADTGFVVGGGANPSVGTPTYKFARFSQKN